MFFSSKAYTVLLNAIGEDYKATGRCDFAMGAETFLTFSYAGFALTKNAPYTDEITKELVMT